jgi:hypothetical protein
MKTKSAVLCPLFTLGVLTIAIAAARAGTPFTYQGLLVHEGVPANGYYDMQPQVFTSPTNGTPVGSLILSNVCVSNGLFVLELDLNELIPPWHEYVSSRIETIDDEIVWIIVNVRQTAGGGPFVPLAPRQKMTFAPRAAFARVAGTVPDGTVTEAKLGTNSVKGWAIDDQAVETKHLMDGAVVRSKLPEGVIDSSALADMAVTSDKLAMDAVMMGHLMDYSVTGPKIADGSVVRSLNGLQEHIVLNATSPLLLVTNTASLTLSAPGVAVPGRCQDYANCYWTLLGNTVDASKWLGTINNFPLNVKVNSVTALRIVPTASTANLIGGHPNNSVPASIVGGTIGGGGTANSPNVVNANFGTISGGSDNLVDWQANFGAVGGGLQNLIQTNSPYATIAGGEYNTIASFAVEGTIGGGSSNRIESSTSSASVGGGQNNTAAATWSTVAGGVNNRAGGVSSAVGGGNYNAANGGDATVAGGRANAAAAVGAAVGGGADNTSSGDYAAIGGGQSNRVMAMAVFARIGGGFENTIEYNGDYAGIGAGRGNVISNAWYATVGGGLTNSILALGDYSSIGGGRGNMIEAGASYATIGGGSQNIIQSTADYATIPGGYRAAVTNYGQMAYASGAFSANGDAQSSLYVLRRTTATNTPTELLLDGSSQRMRVPADATWAFDILIIARTAGTFSAGYHLRGVIENNAGATVLDGTLIKDILNEDDATWDATVLADNANDALVIQVTGAAADTVRWVAKVRTVEVTFP